MIKPFFGPRPVCAEERIGEDGALSHDGDYGDLGGFSGGDERLIFGFHVGAGATWLGESRVIEMRYLADLADAIIAAGLMFERNALAN